jgi:hypothetical protein
VDDRVVHFPGEVQASLGLNFAYEFKVTSSCDTTTPYELNLSETELDIF